LDYYFTLDPLTSPTSKNRRGAEL